MIPPHLETQIRENMEATRTQALLAQMFSGINQRTETAAREREDDKLSRVRYWWHKKEENA